MRAGQSSTEATAVLKARGIEITLAQKVLVKRCTNSARLDRWLERAATANAAGDIFA